MSSKHNTTDTQEEAKPALVPKLRFAEFRDEDGWKSIPLNRLAIRAKTKNRDETINRVLTNSAEYGVVDQRDFFDKDIATQGKLEGYFVVEIGSYVYNPRISSTAPVGPISKNKLGTGVMSPLYTVFKFKDDRNEFYEYFFKTNGWHTYMRSASSTGARHDRMAISSDDFMAMPLPVPLPNEQQKIAECLSSVDGLIAAQARKVDALKTHKKGLMQQLFPREGETQPRLRFPEFHNAGEWVTEPLGDLGEIVTGKTPSTKESDLWGGDILFITPTDISEDEKYQHTTARTVIETKSTKILPVGSVVYTCIASIGKMSLTVHPSISNQQINAVVPNNKVLGEFIYYALVNLTPWIKAIPATNTLPIINKTDFSKIAILLPNDKTEQQRIADCLTSLDDLIAAQTQKHEALKTHKKGLMQQLFPSAEEVEA